MALTGILSTRWITVGLSTTTAHKRHVLHRRKLCRLTFRRTCCWWWVCVVTALCSLLLLLGVCLLNLLDPHTRPLPPAGDDPGDVTLLVWTRPFGHHRLPDCEGRYGIRGCTLTEDRSAYPGADAVIIHHREIVSNVSMLPPEPRPANQKWIWMNFESPTHTRNLRRLRGVFNLTMTYRTDSHIFVPYGRLVPSPPSPHGGRLLAQMLRPRLRPHLLAWVVSNWSEAQARVAFFRRLNRYVRVDVFGHAGLPLPEDSGDSVVQTVRRYQFYLALENSQHTDYITEKLWNALLAGAVPVVLGPPRENYERFLPPDAFIHVDDFPSARGLAQYLLLLHRSPAHLQRHLAWRRKYRVHLSTFWAEHYCAACRVVKNNRGRTSEVTDLAGWFQS